MRIHPASRHSKSPITGIQLKPWLLVLIATMGNSLGGLTNVILGRFFPLREKSRWQEKAVGWLKRYGAATLLLSWMPVIGDLLCLK